MSDAKAQMVSSVRVVGTTSATIAFALFIFSIGLFGWIATPLLGVLSSASAALALGVLGYVWFAVQTL